MEKYKTSLYRDEQFYCPRCGESLVPADIEEIPRCPYCNAPIEQNLRYEDYILRPLVAHWMERENKQFPRH